MIRRSIRELIAADRFVNWNDPAHFGGICWRPVRASNQLDLRVHHFKPARAVRVGVHLSMHHEALPLLEFAFEVCAMKKTGIERS